MFNAVRGFLPKKETLSRERKAQLVSFLKRLSLRCNNFTLLDMAFHHRSFSNENHGGSVRYNNERLEFLGDTVLGLSVASFLYKTFPDKTEGELSKIKSVVVSEMTLSQIASSIGIDALLILGKGEELSGGRQKKAILADTLESVIGAVYLDAGYAAAEKLVLSLITPEITKVHEKRHQQDYKTLLQEYCQKKFKHYPEYILIKKIGPDHDRTFMVSVKLSGSEYGPEKGKNKKEAEQAAAKVACETLNISEM
jgi:ribonuclease-3